MRCFRAPECFFSSYLYSSTSPAVRTVTAAFANGKSWLLITMVIQHFSCIFLFGLRLFFLVNVQCYCRRGIKESGKGDSNRLSRMHDASCFWLGIVALFCLITSISRMPECSGETHQSPKFDQIPIVGETLPYEQTDDWTGRDCGR